MFFFHLSIWNYLKIFGALRCNLMEGRILVTTRGFLILGFIWGGDPPQSPPSLGKTLTPCLTNNSDQLLEEQVEYDKRLQPRLQR